MGIGNLTNCEILITGGCGSLGQTLTKLILQQYNAKGIRIFSRDEFKQASFLQKINQWRSEDPKMITPVSFCIGDVRDHQRLSLAMKGVDIVVHTAAMKRIEQCEDNPIEAIETNVYGAQNVILAAIDNNVERVINISTDKAVAAQTLYGCTKATAEKLFIQANHYSRGKERRPKFSCCRYGNIFGSRGSVIQLFREQAKTGEVTITHPMMTRFFISLERVGRFVLFCLGIMKGQEIFIPEMPSISILEMAEFLAPKAKIKISGIRQGEKIHEVLLTEDEGMRSTLIGLPEELQKFDMKGYYTIYPNNTSSKPIKSYNSDDNYWHLNLDLLEQFENEKFAY